MKWFFDLFTAQSVAQTVIVYGLVIAVGVWLGRLKIAGISLGVTWILFVGLGLSYAGISVNKELEHFLKEFGLILFVYCIGLQVGPGFFASLKNNAHITNLLAATVVLLGIGITIAFKYITGTPIQILTGIMSGAVTNTPGLGAAQTAITDLKLDASGAQMMTLAYALAYPFGVFGIIATLLILKKIFKTNIDAELALYQRFFSFKSQAPISRHFLMENKSLEGQPIRKLFELITAPLVVSRLMQNGHVITPTPTTILHQNDVLLIVAPRRDMEKVKIIIGRETNDNLKDASDSELVSRHVVVTKSTVTHTRIGQLPELHHPGFTLTRLNRAGIEMVPHGDIKLQLGDVLKVVGDKENVDQVTNVLGNSLKKLESPELGSIFMGIVLGVIVGSIPFHFPNIPVAVKIGLAGGPLIVALLLSRFGNVVYLNNYTTRSANLFVREMGIALFLASVGLGSGHSLAQAFQGGQAWQWIGMGITITMVPLLIVGLVAKYAFKKSFFEICGLLAGASTDPPALAFATQLAKSDLPSITYATVYPLTMILRIIGAQLLILFLAS